MSLWLPSILRKFQALTWGAYAYWKGGTMQGRHRWSHPPCQDVDNGKWKSKLKPCIQLHLARTKGACRRQGTGDKASKGVEEHVSGHKRPSSAGLSITEVIETCWHCARHPFFFFFFCFKLPVCHTAWWTVPGNNWILVFVFNVWAPSTDSQLKMH